MSAKYIFWVLWICLLPSILLLLGSLYPILFVHDERKLYMIGGIWMYAASWASTGIIVFVLTICGSAVYFSIQEKVKKNTEQKVNDAIEQFKKDNHQ